LRLWFSGLWQRVVFFHDLQEHGSNKRIFWQLIILSRLRNYYSLHPFIRALHLKVFKIRTVDLNEVHISYYKYFLYVEAFVRKQLKFGLRYRVYERYETQFYLLLFSELRDTNFKKIEMY
jgi:hypothetical protein